MATISAPEKRTSFTNTQEKRGHTDLSKKGKGKSERKRPERREPPPVRKGSVGENSRPSSVGAEGGRDDSGAKGADAFEGPGDHPSILFLYLAGEKQVKTGKKG